LRKQLLEYRVLDPACGSGNFIYVALKQILDLEKKVSVFAASNGLSGLLPRTSPEQLYGIETNVYAHELASVVVWIGYIQWQHDNGFNFGSHPILKPLKNIRRMDAVLAYDEKGSPVEPAWPDADVIIGNPPFLGGKKQRTELGDKNVEDLFALYEGRVPHESDLVCYWFEKARQQIANDKAKRAGLLATQGIRGGANRTVLERIKESGDIFWAQSDRDWILDGATVHVSMIGFDGGAEHVKALNGVAVQSINTDLTTGLDLTKAHRLHQNENLCYMGDTKGGSFDIPDALAAEMLSAPLNPNGRSNVDVIKPWVNASDIGGRIRGMWIIDFGTMTADQAALYEKPFEYVRTIVQPERANNRRETYKDKWWIHAEPRPAMKQALSPLNRFIATIAVGKHRHFVWLQREVTPDHALLVFARDDDYFFGILHSRPHELWARGKGTQLREAESGFRYTPTSTFETFPFPWPPGKEPKDDPRVEAIAAAARELVRKREGWLNPPDASAAELKKRTLTNLYNENPTWLQDAHRELDDAVLAAYGWPDNRSDQDILTRLLQLNAERSCPPI
jgi:type II restriction/modification system DNA methylase subunit YeeA